MDEQSLKIVKCLVKMAKADGQISPEERSLLVQVLPAAGATTEAADDLEKLLDKLIEEVATGDTIELNPAELDEEKRHGVMRALLIMSFMDGHVSFGEFSQIETMQKQLQISDEHLETLRSEAVAAAETISAS